MDPVGIAGKRQIWGILARKSKVYGEGNHRRELSTEAQITTGRREAEQDGAVVPQEYVWSELGSAFKDRERDDFETALAALADGRINVLWCYRLDRFSRKGADDLLRVIGKVRVIFWLDRLDSMEERDRRRIIDYAEQAREYSVFLADSVGATKRTQRDAGMWLSRAPDGYVVGPGRKLLRNTAPFPGSEAPRWEVIDRIIEEAADHEHASTRAIVSRLNGDGIPAARGGRWSAAAVHRIIFHPVYEGWQVVTSATGNKPLEYFNRAGERVSVTDEPIVTDPEKLARARARITGNTSPTSGAAMPAQTAAGRAKHQMSGATRCEGCMGAVTLSGSGYTCSLHKNDPGSCPRPARLDARLLDEWARDRFIARVENIDASDPDEPDIELMMTITKLWSAHQRPEETEAEKKARASLKAAEAARDRLQAAFDAGAYDGDAVAMFASSMQTATANVAENRLRVAKFGGSRPVVPWIGNEHLLRAKWDSSTPDERRELLQLGVRFVVIRRWEGKPPNRWEPVDVDQRATMYWHGDTVPASLLAKLSNVKSRKAGKRASLAA
ncbi:recombinase family protein [Streptomyces sp. NPDC098789]|uniref:recombinase family protein n=1 Tax=Streptomyces sp. NPDC098789 TaxID=3366098 RepID=UPI0037F71907